MARAARNKKKKKLGRGRRFATGIDVGHYSVKIATLEGDDAGGFAIKKITVLPLQPPESAEYEEELRDRQKEALKEALKKHGKTEGYTVLGFPRDLATIRYLNLPSTDPRELQEMLLFDVERHVPFPIEDLEITFQIISRLGEHESRVMMICAPTKELDPYVDMCRELGIDLDAIDLDILGDCAAYSNGLQPKETLAVVDFGRSSVKFGVVRDNVLLFSRSLPIAESRLLQGFAGAKSWRDLQGRVTAAGALHPNERDHFAQWVERLGMELYRSISAFLCEEDDVRLDRMILCGAAGYFPAGPPRGLNLRIKTKTSIEPALNGELPSSDLYHGTELAAATGLALRGIQLQEGRSNLLPESFIREREQYKRSAIRKNIAILSFMILTLLCGAGYLKWHESYLENTRIDTFFQKIRGETNSLDKMRKKIDTVEHYLDSKHSCLKILQQVLTVLDKEKIYISNINFTKRKTLEIVGQTLNENNVNRINALLNDLKPGPNEELFFTRVVIPSSQVRSLPLGAKELQVFTFRINCFIRWEEDET